ncbi:MAG: hypothetical protein CMF41_06195 [Legionellales bacterium]|nr:hypothetical protein [Legionellales bacterium]OUX64174.1 MAG: hypothetical protein CBE41_03740 [Gammaproteobacteria bacterium TMED281]
MEGAKEFTIWINLYHVKKQITSILCLENNEIGQQKASLIKNQLKAEFASFMDAFVTYSSDDLFDEIDSAIESLEPISDELINEENLQDKYNVYLSQLDKFDDFYEEAWNSPALDKESRSPIVANAHNLVGSAFTNLSGSNSTFVLTYFKDLDKSLAFLTFFVVHALHATFKDLYHVLNFENFKQQLPSGQSGIETMKQAMSVNEVSKVAKVLNDQNSKEEYIARLDHEPFINNSLVFLIMMLLCHRSEHYALTGSDDSFEFHWENTADAIVSALQLNNDDFIVSEQISHQEAFRDDVLEITKKVCTNPLFLIKYAYDYVIFPFVRLVVFPPESQSIGSYAVWKNLSPSGRYKCLRYIFQWLLQTKNIPINDFKIYHRALDPPLTSITRSNDRVELVDNIVRFFDSMPIEFITTVVPLHDFLEEGYIEQGAIHLQDILKNIKHPSKFEYLLKLISLIFKHGKEAYNLTSIYRRLLESIDIDYDEASNLSLNLSSVHEAKLNRTHPYFFHIATNLLFAPWMSIYAFKWYEQFLMIIRPEHVDFSIDSSTKVRLLVHSNFQSVTDSTDNISMLQSIREEISNTRYLIDSMGDHFLSAIPGENPNISFFNKIDRIINISLQAGGISAEKILNILPIEHLFESEQDQYTWAIHIENFLRCDDSQERLRIIHQMILDVITNGREAFQINAVYRRLTHPTISEELITVHSTFHRTQIEQAPSSLLDLSNKVLFGPWITILMYEHLVHFFNYIHPELPENNIYQEFRDEALLQANSLFIDENNPLLNETRSLLKLFDILGEKFLGSLQNSDNIWDNEVDKIKQILDVAVQSLDEKVRNTDPLASDHGQHSFLSDQRLSNVFKTTIAFLRLIDNTMADRPTPYNTEQSSMISHAKYSLEKITYSFALIIAMIMIALLFTLHCFNTFALLGGLCLSMYLVWELFRIHFRTFFNLDITNDIETLSKSIHELNVINEESLDNFMANIKYFPSLEADICAGVYAFTLTISFAFPLAAMYFGAYQPLMWIIPIISIGILSWLHPEKVTKLENNGFFYQNNRELNINPQTEDVNFGY